MYNMVYYTCIVNLTVGDVINLTKEWQCWRAQCWQTASDWLWSVLLQVFDLLTEESSDIVIIITEDSSLRSPQTSSTPPHPPPPQRSSSLSSVSYTTTSSPALSLGHRNLFMFRYMYNYMYIHCRYVHSPHGSPLRSNTTTTNFPSALD